MIKHYISISVEISSNAVSALHQSLWSVGTSSNQINPAKSSCSAYDLKGNSIACQHFYFGLQQQRLCKTDLSGLKLSVNIANPHSKLLCTEVKGLYQTVRKQTLYVFRTWIIRQCNTVRVRKLAYIVTSLWLGIVVLPKELSSDTCMWKPFNNVIFGINEGMKV